VARDGRISVFNCHNWTGSGTLLNTSVNPIMDHSYIEEASLADRYVRGRMPVAERVAFEEHFLDCRECLEQLEIARSFMEGVKIAATGVAERPKVWRLPFGDWLTGLGSWRTAGLVAAAFLIVLIVPGTLLIKYSAFQAARDSFPAVYVLNEVRGPEAAQEAPANRIMIPKSPRWMVLAVERDFSQYRTYRVVVRNRDGKAVWQQDNLEASSPDAMGISFPSTVLSPGNYTVSLVALSPAGQVVPLANYSFRAAQ
jgi:hypothetical protein